MIAKEIDDLLAGPEADALVAPFLGWEYQAGIERWVEPGGKMAHVAPPPFSTAISAAWQLVDSIAKPWLHVDTNSFGTGAIATVIENRKSPRLYQASADTLPLALVQAFLIYKNRARA